MDTNKGWLRKAFEHQLDLKPEQCLMDEQGHYKELLTQALWGAFKAGIHCKPTRGRFVVASVDEWGLPNFPAVPLVHDFLDLAKNHQRDSAMRTGAVHLVYQQVSAFHPEREHA